MPGRDSSKNDSISEGIGPSLLLSLRGMTPISPSLVIRSWSRSQGRVSSCAPAFPSSEIADNGNSWGDVLFSYIFFKRNGTRKIFFEYNVTGETALNTPLKVAITRSSFSSPRLV